MIITQNDLKHFQLEAASNLASMIMEYPNEKFKRFDPDTGELMPFLCRLSAITGAGKTPMLAQTASILKNGIILWTTNRGAIISQTLTNLAPGGKYEKLLPANTKVFTLGDVSAQDWEEIMEAETGLTILLATVASFNQDGDKLKIHKGNPTRWEMLGGKTINGRRRSLYVFYDEGHGATEKQFTKLRELKPRAFVLASASPLPEDLYDLLSGKTDEERKQSLIDRTVLVSTQEVVQANLLKNRLYLVECNTAKADAIFEANKKWEELSKKLSSEDSYPVICFVVNSTLRGVEVWENLLKLGVNKSKIAVHLNGAEDVIVDKFGSLMGLIDTYKLKKSPENLRDEGFTHLIWNLSLREGWDEPYAYVGYFDDRGRSNTDRVQKIGRFLRQPNAAPFIDPDLNSAYFYFNIEDEDFEALIGQIQKEMEVEGYEVIGVKASGKSTTSVETPVIRPMTIPGIVPGFGEDISRLDKIILDNTPYFHESVLRARGKIITEAYDLLSGAKDLSKHEEREMDSTDVITPWEFISTRLSAIDSRIVNDSGTRFSGSLKEHPKMCQPMQYGSEAMEVLDRNIPTIREQLNHEFRLYSKGKFGKVNVLPFKLISPNIEGGTPLQQERYKVREFKNAVHQEYNGMNQFEVKVAEALDSLRSTWCRNPSKTGYAIPIPELGSGTQWFYPDFILWTDKVIWAIDPKGLHIAQEAITRKLLYISDIDGLEIKIKIAFILDGAYNLGNNNNPKLLGKDGATLIRNTSAGIKAVNSKNVLALVKELVQNP